MMIWNVVLVGRRRRANSLECSVLVKLHKSYEDLPKYENIFDGTVDEQVKIARIFKKHMWLKENLKKD